MPTHYRGSEPQRRALGALINLRRAVNAIGIHEAALMRRHGLTAYMRGCHRVAQRAKGEALVMPSHERQRRGIGFVRKSHALRGFAADGAGPFGLRCVDLGALPPGCRLGLPPPRTPVPGSRLPVPSFRFPDWLCLAI